jgi:putative salt-induced outer membrane protein YdiY
MHRSLGLLILASVLAAADDNPPAVTGTWAPPQAGQDTNWTWIQIVSDEWLKGEILDMRDGTLEFDSDELDELDFDWEDIKTIITERQHTVQMWDRKTYTGKLRQEDGKLIVIDASGKEYVLDQEDVQSIVDGRPTERNFWSGSVSLGFTARSGNSSQRDASALIRIDRRALETRWLNIYNATLSSVDGTKTAENHRFTSNFDWFFTPRLFFTPIFYEYFRDPFQNIQYRHSPGLGMGYDLFSNKTKDWDVSAGIGFRQTQYESVPAGDENPEEDVFLTAGTVFEWDITGDIEFDLTYDISTPTSDLDAYTANMLAVLSIEMQWDLDIDFTLAWDRQNRPKVDSDGNTPDQDDFRFTIGLGYDF